MNDAKLCKDCKHHTMVDPGPFYALQYACDVEKLIDVVDGKPVYRKCSFQRSEKGKCGPDGKLFEV
jgi:hypothetical protein